MSIYLGIAYDAMRELGHNVQDFYMNIKPMGGYDRLISGPALTTFGRVVDPSENYTELDNIRLNIYKRNLFEKNPIVLLQANDDAVAHSGDITSMIYQTLGAAGFVTDGNVRDIERISDLNFPCFCADVNPIDALDYWALTDFNVPIEIKGVKISPGDMIYASADGVIRVPKNILTAFNERMQAILDKENGIRTIIESMRDSEDFTSEFEAFVKTSGRW